VMPSRKQSGSGVWITPSLIGKILAPCIPLPGHDNRASRIGIAGARAMLPIVQSPYRAPPPQPSAHTPDPAKRYFAKRDARYPGRCSIAENVTPIHAAIARWILVARAKLLSASPPQAIGQAIAVRQLWRRPYPGKPDPFPPLYTGSKSKFRAGYGTLDCARWLEISPS
jgi:hypothetical protein